VYFSNPGQPECGRRTAQAGRGRNFLDLTPGDGEQILAAVTWRELVFIFKETKFFVLWGESTAADGTRSSTSARSSTAPASRRKRCRVGRDGVYFLNRRGVYHTNGGDPELCQRPDRPVVDRRPGGLLPGLPDQPRRSSQLARMAWLNEQLFVAVPTGNSSTFNDRLLVYDTQHQWWTVYDIPRVRADGVPAGRPRRAALRLLDGDRTGSAGTLGSSTTAAWRS
jgi:hypothetical protein